MQLRRIISCSPRVIRTQRISCYLFQMGKLANFQFNLTLQKMIRGVMTLMIKTMLNIIF